MRTFESIFVFSPPLNHYLGFPHSVGENRSIRPEICSKFVRKFLHLYGWNVLPDKIKIKVSTSEFYGARQLLVNLRCMWWFDSFAMCNFFYTSTENILRYKLSKHIEKNPDMIIRLWIGIKII